MILRSKVKVWLRRSKIVIHKGDNELAEPLPADAAATIAKLRKYKLAEVVGAEGPTVAKCEPAATAPATEAAPKKKRTRKPKTPKSR